MRHYSKVGSQKGKPGYRTPAPFRYRQYLKIKQMRLRHYKRQKTIKP